MTTTLRLSAQQVNLLQKIDSRKFSSPKDHGNNMRTANTLKSFGLVVFNTEGLLIKRTATGTAWLKENAPTPAEATAE